MVDEKVNPEETLQSEEVEKNSNEEKKIESSATPESASDRNEKQKKQGQQSAFQLTDEQRQNLSMILDLPLKVSVELGRARVLIQEILQYGQGSVVELNKKAGDHLEITVANQLIARGEVVVVNEKFAVRITEIVDPETRIKKMSEAGKDSTHVLNAGESEASSGEENSNVEAG